MFRALGVCGSWGLGFGGLGFRGLALRVDDREVRKAPGFVAWPVLREALEWGARRNLRNPTWRFMGSYKWSYKIYP